MDLRTFIRETLAEIIAGISEAQEGLHGGDINARGGGHGVGGHLFSAGTFGTFTRVDFEVALTAETATGGKAGIQVFDIGAGAEGLHKSASANRIAFSVPLRLPDGTDRPRSYSPPREA
jgi:hypothetical protein